jgi:hypothetical protein
MADISSADAEEAREYPEGTDIFDLPDVALDVGSQVVLIEFFRVQSAIVYPWIPTTPDDVRRIHPIRHHRP